MGSPAWAPEKREAAEVLAWPAGPGRTPRPVPGLAGHLGRTREELPVPGPRRDWQPGRPASCSSGARPRSLRPPCPGVLLPPALLCALCGGHLATASCAGVSADRCSWRGSGLTQEPGSVGQLPLACAEAGIPAEALRPTLGRSDLHTRPRIACLRPAQPFVGVQVFAELTRGALERLLAEGRARGPRERRALFLQATLHRDLSRRVATCRRRPTVWTLPLFQVGGSGCQVQASIRTPLHCGVHPGLGTFPFMGSSYFGEAWLGFAP
ncbi:LOW QUALITY PROTEIN: meteorin [Rhynchonycteris naso]